MLALFLPLPLRAAAAPGDPPVVLASGGRAACVVACSSDAPPAVAFAAHEVSRYLGEMCGEAPPLVPASSAAIARQVTLAGQSGTPAEWLIQTTLHGGQTVTRRYSAQILLVQAQLLAEEEFTIRTAGQTIIVSGGGKRGVLYGCMSLLEDTLGVRWYNQRVTKVPHEATIRVPATNRRSRPAFEYREPYCRETLNRDWAVHNRCNGNFMPLDDSVGGQVDYGRFTHTFAEICPPKVYFASHPEYFSLVDGKRQDGYAQLCLTNPAVVKLAVEKVKQWIKEDPRATIFSVSQNDTYKNCQCDNCKAVEREEGSASGPLLRFVNQVADEIGKEHPNVLIDTLAYQWSEDPPRLTRPHKNVRVRLAPLGACVGHGFDQCDANRHVLQNLTAWSHVAHQLYVWHYCTNFAHYLQPLPDLDEIAHDIPLMKQKGVVGIFYEGDYAKGGGGEMQELKSYLAAKLLWDPTRPSRPIIDDYLRGVYGKGAPYISKWLDLLYQPVRAQGRHVYVYDPPTAAYLPDSTLAQGDRLFDAAERATAGDALAHDEVNRARLALEYLELMRTAPAYGLKGDTYAPLATGRHAELVASVTGKIQRYGIGQVREGEPVQSFLARIAAPAKSYAALTLESRRVRVTVVPALGGRIVSLIDKLSGHDLMRSAGPRDAGYPAAGGYEEYTSAEYRAPGWSEEYTLTEAPSTGAATLSATLPNGIRLTRVYNLSDDTLRIETTARNVSEKPVSIQLRTHPEFATLPGKPCELSLQYGSHFVFYSPGSIPGRPERQTYSLAANNLPDGSWTLDFGGAKLTESFDPADIVEADVDWSADRLRVNLELYGKPRLLAPGEQVSLVHAWQVRK